MSKKVKLGLIGAGKMGRMHAENIVNNVKDAEVLAVSDLYSDKIKDWAENLGIGKVYKDYWKILNDPEIDAVLICSSTNTHARIITDAANSGRDIFCEKPIDVDLAAINEALKAVEKNGVKLQIGFNVRFDNQFGSMQKLINEGKVGKVQVLKISTRDPEPPTVDYVKVSGGIFLDMTIHDIDMARFLVGDDVEEVYAAGSVLIDPQIGECGDVDTSILTLKFKGGALGVIDNSRQAVYGFDTRAEVLGPKGCITITNETPNTAVLNAAGGAVSENPLFDCGERYRNSYINEMRAFVDAVANGKTPLVNGLDGLKAVLIAKAATKSVQTGLPVKVDEQ